MNPTAVKPLRILILGGTGFIGPHQVRYAIERGHTVTLFNRGQTRPGLFDNVEQLHGDRARNPGDYGSLAGREWDVVIDNPTMRPRWVREAGAALAGCARQYLFVSTVSVYADNGTPGADETAAVGTTDTPDVESYPIGSALYGPLKALAEREAERAFPRHATIVRPGLIVGSGDPSDRFTYWPVRIARGGEVLAPPADDLVQLIDVRDLAEWTIRCCEEERYGVFNATGPATGFTVREMLEGARDAVGSTATFTYVTSEFLKGQGVNEWSDLPVWISSDGDAPGFAQRSIARALSAGLTFRTYADTVRETLAFYRRESVTGVVRAGPAPDREQELLAAWHAGR